MVSTTGGWSVVRSPGAPDPRPEPKPRGGEPAAGLRTRESTDELVARVGTRHWSSSSSSRAVFMLSRGVRTSSSPRPRRDRPPPRGVGAGPVRPASAGDVEEQTAGVDAASAMLQSAATTFDAQLLRPLAAQLRDRPLVVVPTGALQSIPWSVLPSCLGRPVTVSPSAALWNRAASRPGPEQGAEVVVVAGPGSLAL